MFDNTKKAHKLFFKQHGPDGPVFELVGESDLLEIDDVSITIPFINRDYWKLTNPDTGKHDITRDAIKFVGEYQEIGKLAVDIWKKLLDGYRLVANKHLSQYIEKGVLVVEDDGDWDDGGIGISLSKNVIVE